MRTKSLLLAAAISAAGLATSMAQVYSVNIVGYVTKTLPAGKLSLIQNPLKASTNTIAELFKTLPDGANIFRFVPPGFVTIGVDFGIVGNAQGDEKKELLPGEGVFVKMPGGQDLTITFVGDVMTGNLTNNIPVGLSMRGSQVPQAGTVAALGFVPGDDDIIFKWNATKQAYDTFQYSFGAWDPSVPSFEVGEAAFFKTQKNSNWTRQFTVN